MNGKGLHEFGDESKRMKFGGGTTSTRGGENRRAYIVVDGAVNNTGGR